MIRVVLRRLQVKAPYRGTNKLPAEPVVMIFPSERRGGKIAGVVLKYIVRRIKKCRIIL